MTGKQSAELRPDAREVLEELARSSEPPAYTLDVVDARERSQRGAEQRLASRPSVAAASDVVVGFDPDVPVRIYQPEEERAGIVIYFHGGGWSTESVDTYDELLRRLTNAVRRTVVAVDYRLAPEHPFPAAVEDAMASFRWAQDYFGAKPIAVSGDSAGGNLATVLSRKARDQGLGGPACQVLIYPGTDLTMTGGSHMACAEGYGFTEAHHEWFRSMYLSDPYHAYHPDASPNLASDLAGLPPALVITAEFDPIRDEGEVYATRLQQAAVPTVLRRFEGQIHGFMGNPASEDAGRALRMIRVFFDQYLEGDHS